MKNPAFTIISQRKYPVKVTYAKSTKKGAKRYSKSLYCKVTVKECILKSVKQTKFDTIEAVVAGKMPTVKPQDVVITNTSNNAVSAVKSVAVDEKDSTKLIITTYAAMNDGKDYTVAFSGMSKEFTATDGKVADVAVSPLTITANTTGSEVKAQLLDKNQVVVEEYGIGDALPGKVDYSITSGNGYTSGNKLVLPEVGNTATAKVTYHSFEYDSTGVETGVIEKTFTITAVADSATTSNWNYTITKDSSVNWKSSVQKVTEIATNDVRNAFFYFVDSGKNDVTANYSVESSDNSILLLANTPLTAASVAGSNAVSVTGVNPGTAYINVLKDGKVVTSLPVTVKTARKLSDIKLGKTTLYSSNDGTVTEKDETTIKGYDQYGEEYSIATVTGTILNAPSNAITGHQKDDSITVLSAPGKIGPSAGGFEKGDYLVKVEAKDSSNNAVSKTITLKAVDTASISASVYELSISSSEVDLAIASSTTTGHADKDLTIKVVEKKGNAPVAVESTAKITVTNPKNVKIKDEAVGTQTLSLVSEIGGVVTKNITELGTYSVHAEYNDGTKTHKFDRTFTLKDTQSKASVDVKKTKELGVPSTGNAIVDAENVLEAAGVAEYYYDGVKVVSVDITVPSGSAKENGNALYVGTVNIKVTTTPGGLTVDVPVEINRTFTLG